MIKINYDHFPRKNNKIIWSECVGMTADYNVDNKTTGRLLIKSYNPDNGMLQVHSNKCDYEVSIKQFYNFLPIAITDEEASNMFCNKNYCLTESRNSHKKISVKCPSCGYIWEIAPYRLVDRVNKCSKCSDGLSYPFKYVAEVVRQLSENYNVTYEHEAVFDWCKFKGNNNEDRTGRYDICLWDIFENKLIEVDGGFHRKDNTLSGQTHKESVYIDNEKDRLALENNFTPIHVKAEYPYNDLKGEIIKSFSDYYDLSIIDWDKCEKAALNSKVLEVSKIWELSNKTTEDIGKELGYSRTSIRNWLKKGQSVGLNNYCVQLAKERTALKNSGSNSKNNKPIICLNTREVFESVLACAQKFNVSSSKISEACDNSKDKSVDYNGEKYYFMKLSEYEEHGNLKKWNLDKQEGFIGESTYHREKRCVCLNDGLKFVSMKAAAEYYNLNRELVVGCCSHTVHRVNNKYVFRFYDEYLEMSEEDINKALNYKNKSSAKPIKCLNNGRVFNSLQEATEWCGGSMGHISACAHGKRRTSGRDPVTNELLRWSYCIS